MIVIGERGGVWKWVLIIAAVLVLLACVGGFIMVRLGGNYLKSHGKEMASGMVVRALRMQIEKNLPAGYDQAKVEETFKGLELGMKEGKVKPEALGPIGSEIGNAMQDGKMTSEELDKILDDIKKLSAPPS